MRPSLCPKKLLHQKEPDRNHLRCCEVYSALKPISVVAPKTATDSMDRFGHVPIRLPGAELGAHIQDL